MEKTSIVTAEIDAEIKTKAEEILAKLGITPSAAIQMFYQQIVLKRGIPFDLRLPYPKPLCEGAMTREELNAEIQKGIDSAKAGRVYTADEVERMLEEEFGISDK